MSDPTLVIERTRQDAALTPPQPSATLAAAPPRRAGPIVAMVSGIVVIALAGGVFIGGRGGRGGMPRPAPDPLAITLSARDVSVVVQVYEPGETSGWHSHAGIHAVAVLSGVLTVYDADCRRETFEPGRPYVGGQQPHLVRNESDAPVTMTVTYLNPSVPANSNRHVPTPAGCTIE